MTFGAPKRLGSGARLLNSNVVSQLRGFFVPDFLNPLLVIVKTPYYEEKYASDTKYPVFIKISVAEPEQVEPKLFETWNRSRNYLFNR